MGNRICTRCGNIWLGDLTPFCPACMAYDWDNTAGFIKPKHNPLLLPLSLPQGRSVVTADFIFDKSLYINTIAYNGEYFYDTKYNNFSCVLRQPLGMTAGSGIPANFPLPTYPLDSQIVVDIFRNPHVYAEDYAVIQVEIASARLIMAVFCDVPGCTNLAVPSTTKCQLH